MIRTVEEDKKKAEVFGPPPSPKRISLPDERESVTRKFVLPGAHEGEDVKGYITAGFYPSGDLGEVFLTVGKAGDLWKAYDALMIVLSIGLQHGIPLETFADKLRGMNFKPRGITRSEDIPIATSIVDYVARWLEIKVAKGEWHGDVASSSEPPSKTS